MTVLDIPLFPLQSVLFPGGRLTLKIFEQRYMDMATACLKAGSPFGICLIARGSEVGGPAEPHAVGTLARIAEWDMAHLGVLQVVAQGDERFRILDRRAEPSGLLRAQVQLLPAGPLQAVPGDYARLVPLLQAVLDKLGDKGPAKPYRYADAAWLGYRWCEVLPIPSLARQKLLELDDDLSRLEIVWRYLEQKGLFR